MTKKSIQSNNIQKEGNDLVKSAKVVGTKFTKEVVHLEQITKEKLGRTFGLNSNYHEIF